MSISGVNGIGATAYAYMNSSIWYLGTIPLAQREAVKKQAVISDELATHTYYFNVKNDLINYLCMGGGYGYFAATKL